MRIALISVFLSLFLFLPMSVDAQGLVNCSGPDCDFCSAMNMANNIINWLIGILAVVAVLIFVVAGFRLVTSAGNPEAMSFFKARLLYIVIGFTLVLTAWLIVDAMLRGLTEQGGLEFWGRFDVEQCSSQNNPSLSVVEDPDITPIDILVETENWSAAPVGSNGVRAMVSDCDYDCQDEEDECRAVGGVPTTDTSSSGTVTCQNDSRAVSPGTSGSGSGVSPTGNLVSYAGYQFDSSILEYVQYLDTNFDLRVSSGYRDPARNAAANGAARSYHLQGRAVDLVGTQAEMERGRAWTLANGAREALVHDFGSGLHLHAAW